MNRRRCRNAFLQLEALESRVVPSLLVDPDISPSSPDTVIAASSEDGTEHQSVDQPSYRFVDAFLLDGRIVRTYVVGADDIRVEGFATVDPQGDTSLLGGGTIMRGPTGDTAELFLPSFAVPAGYRLVEFRVTDDPHPTPSLYTTFGKGAVHGRYGSTVEVRLDSRPLHEFRNQEFHLWDYWPSGHSPHDRTLSTEWMSLNGRVVGEGHDLSIFVHRGALFEASSVTVDLVLERDARPDSLSVLHEPLDADRLRVDSAWRRTFDAGLEAAFGVQLVNPGLEVLAAVQDDAAHTPVRRGSFVSAIQRHLASGKSSESAIGLAAAEDSSEAQLLLRIAQGKGRGRDEIADTLGRTLIDASVDREPPAAGSRLVLLDAISSVLREAAPALPPSEELPAVRTASASERIEADLTDAQGDRIRVSLRRVSSDDLSIRAGVQTWVVIHGRVDSSTSFESLASAIDAYKEGDQVLVLDWSEGAHDNHPKAVGLDGAAWIPHVGEWAKETLQSLNIPSDKLGLVGHSWGSFVAYEIAKRLPGDNEIIVALDPAAGAFGYDFTKVNFGDVSQRAWVFYGSGPFGSADLAHTADESFLVKYDAFLGLVNPSAAHSAPVRVFESLVRRNNQADPPRLASLFSLDKLENSVNGPWANNRYKGGFEGEFTVRDENRNKVWADLFSELVSFRYRKPDGSELTIGELGEDLGTATFKPVLATESLGTDVEISLFDDLVQAKGSLQWVDDKLVLTGDVEFAGGVATVKGNLIVNLNGDVLLTGKGEIKYKQTTIAAGELLGQFSNDGDNSNDSLTLAGIIRSSPLESKTRGIRLNRDGRVEVVDLESNEAQQPNDGDAGESNGNSIGPGGLTDEPPVDSVQQGLGQTVAERLQRTDDGWTLRPVDSPDNSAVVARMNEDASVDSSEWVRIEVQQSLAFVHQIDARTVLVSDANTGVTKVTVEPNTALVEIEDVETGRKTWVPFEPARSPSTVAVGASAVVTALAGHHFTNWVHEHVDEELLAGLVSSVGHAVLGSLIEPLVIGVVDDVLQLGSWLPGIAANPGSLGPWSAISAITPLITSALDLPPELARAVNTATATLTVAMTNPLLAPLVPLAEYVLGALAERQAEKKAKSFREASEKWLSVGNSLLVFASYLDAADFETQNLVARIQAIQGHHPQEMEELLTPLPDQMGRLLGRQVLRGRARLPQGSYAGVEGPWNDQDARSIADWWIRSAATQAYDVIFTELAGLSFDDLVRRYESLCPGVGDAALFDWLFSLYHAADWF